MPKRLIYKLKIDGSYTPENIPLQRLSEYMSDLAMLLGEPSNVHFEDLQPGSAVVAVAVDETAIPKVENRVSLIGKGDAPDDLRKAFDKLDKRLATDNAVGSLSAYADDIQDGSVVLNFPGRERPTPLDYGVIRQQGSLDGVPVNVGGRDKTSHVILEDRNRVYTGINVDRDQAREIAKHLYGNVLRLHGLGSWKRDSDGEWQLQRFRVDSFEVLDGAPLHEILKIVRDIPGSGWGEIDDPMAFFEDLRGDPDERPH